MTTRSRLMLLLLTVASAWSLRAQTTSILHVHASPERNTRAALVLDGSGNLYGTTTNGGAWDVGSAFKIRTDGSGFQELHSFASGEGLYPAGPLALGSDGTLFGTTFIGGSQDAGTIFMLKPDGSWFYTSLSFNGSNGRRPAGAVVFDASAYLYGTTSEGGSRDLGVIYRARTNTASTGFQVLHSFDGYPIDGSAPNAGLVRDSSGNFYGTTANGGSADRGTVFRISADGSGYRVLHSFSGFSSDGDRPFSSLVLDDSGFLYGTTLYGGASGNGTVYRIRTDGTGFQVLRSFLGGASDGRLPFSPVILDGSGNLYGTVARGGPADGGAVFRLRTDGSGYTVLTAFSGAPADGAEPRAGLVLGSTGNLYGTTALGGQANAGTIFRIRTDGGGFQLLRSLPGLVIDGLGPRAGLVRDGTGNLYGTTERGGEFGKGSVFRLRAGDGRMELLHSFEGSTDDGAAPYGSLVLDSAGMLYGTTYAGGSANAGTVFRLRSDGTAFLVLHSFTGGGRDGANPVAGLARDAAGVLYGTTDFGGASSYGTVFRLESDGKNFRLLHSFSYPNESADGSRPRSQLVLDGVGYLYGTTLVGGSLQGNGTVFKLRTDGSDYQILQRFSDCLGSSCQGTSRNPNWPESGVVLDGSGRLYGTTSWGGANNVGTIFTMRTDGTGFAYIHSFGGAPGGGAWPMSNLVLDSHGHLYGATSKGGAADMGAVFRIGLDGSEFRLLHSFSGAPDDGAEPLAPLLLDPEGNLFGTTYRGGLWNAGVEFVIRPDQKREEPLRESEPGGPPAGARTRLSRAAAE